MAAPDDPFRYHPELRGQILDPEQSFFRSFTTADMAALAARHDLPVNWWHSDAEREALRLRELAAAGSGDLWVFAYGSLMWDPAFRFAEIRRARVADHARCFILKDIYGARGRQEAPGLMAALDSGAGCEGLLFRIPREAVAAETEVLWRRERIGPAYHAAFVDAEHADGQVKALAFVADHGATLIDASLTRDEQIRLLATGTGFLGSSLDYIRSIERKFALLGIRDDEVTELRQAAEAYADAL